MNKIEVISSSNAPRLDDYIGQLTDSYIDAFARPPWNEVSQCVSYGGYSPSVSGAPCGNCQALLVEAYKPADLYSDWKRLLDDGAQIELALNDNDVFCRATITGPSTPAQLFESKYKSVEAMEEWLSAALPGEIAYIYETFANLRVSPNGNLRDRGQTLGRIARAFAGMPIVTRTLQPAVVRATVRDAGARTSVYLGASNAGGPQALGARAIGTAPDMRTLLFVEAEQ